MRSRADRLLEERRAHAQVLREGEAGPRLLYVLALSRRSYKQFGTTLFRSWFTAASETSTSPPWPMADCSGGIRCGARSRRLDRPRFRSLYAR